MRFEEAKKLKVGQIIYSITKMTAKGKPLSYRVAKLVNVSRRRELAIFLKLRSKKKKQYPNALLNAYTLSNYALTEHSAMFRLQRG